MSALPRMPYPEKEMPENVKFILPYADDSEITQFFNDRYELIGAYDDMKQEMLDGKALKLIEPYFDKKLCLGETGAKVIQSNFTSAKHLKVAYI